ncbi:MAG TPA: zinc ribbon domain-containing protein [Limosilactobacillus coleohominis]|nr:zinc ribbon domain-containing protein [Limosilactobacillus coleohominis]
MRYCPNCGKEVDPKAVVCPNCGVALPAPVTNNQVVNAQNDTGSVGWAFLGFFIPIVGLILYIIWRNSEPNNAKKAGLGALISVIVWAAFWVLIMIIAAIASAA